MEAIYNIQINRRQTCCRLDLRQHRRDDLTMNHLLYTSHTTITLVGAGPVSRLLFARATGLAPVVIAADGGADTADTMGHPVRAIIGDLDSLHIGKNWRNSGIPVHQISEQGTTDFEKCLYSVAAPLFLCVGFVGGLTDHALAALNALLVYRHKRIILLGEDDLTFLAPLDLRLGLPVGTRISLFPLADVTGVHSEGLRWNVAGLRMRPGGRIGTSNQVADSAVRIGFDRRGVLVTLPLTQLSAVISALTP